MLRGNVQQDIIDAIKGHFTGVSIYKWTTPDGKNDIVFRQLNLADVSDIRQKAVDRTEAWTPAEIDEFIFQTCVMWPELNVFELKNLPIGIIPTITKAIQERSGYVSIDVNNRILGPSIGVKKLVDGATWGTPDELEVKEARKLSRDLPIYQLSIGKYHFIIRPIVRTDVNAGADNVDSVLAICDLITLWPAPVDWDRVPMGVIETLFTEASVVSGQETKQVSIVEL